MNDIIIYMHNGMLMGVEATYPEKVTVTLVDLDNIEEGDKDIYKGNYEVFPFTDFRNTILEFVQDEDLVEIYDENGDLL